MKIYKTTDTELRSSIEKALKENDNYCPCRVDKTPENKCMCREFIELTEGVCHCGLYIKEA